MRLHIALLIVAPAAFAQMRTALSCYSDDTGLFCYPAINSTLPEYYEGVPSFTDLSIRELAVYAGANTAQMVRINPANGIVLSGGLRYSEYVGTEHCQTYTQGYSVGSGKVVDLSINMCHYLNGYNSTEPGHPLISIMTSARWINGSPPTLNGIYAQGGIGMVVRSDHDPYAGSSNSTMEWTRIPISLRPVERGLWHDVTPNQSYWWNARKILARFGEPNGYEAPKKYTMLWEQMDSQTLHYLRGCRYDDYTLYSDNPCTGTPQGPFQDVSYGANSGISYLPGFVNAGGGKDQVAYMITLSPSPSQTTTHETRTWLNIQRQVGTRSIQVRWAAYHNTHVNPDYKAYPDEAGTMRSVREALTTLVSHDPANSIKITTKVETRLRCPFAGNGDNACTLQELYTLQSMAMWPDNEGNFSRYATALNVLQNTSYSLDTPNAGGVVFTGNADPNSVGWGLITRAFVFPRNISSTPWLYFAMAHELGHTFGMGHQWSNCTLAQGWNCPAGTIMSYSASPRMDFGADSRNWFRKAPYNWTHSRMGYGPINSETLEPNNIINW